MIDQPENWSPSTLFRKHTPHNDPRRRKSSGVLSDTPFTSLCHTVSTRLDKLSLVDIANGRVWSDRKAGNGDGGV